MSFIDARGLIKKYHNIKALDKVSFQIEEGEVFGILGPNGAGKSTAIMILATLIKPDEGEIFLNDSSIIKKPALIRPILGLVPQDIALYKNLSAKENLEFWGRIYGIKEPLLKSRITETTQLIGLSDRLGDKVSNMSGGMKRRLNIAASLIHKPRIVIMDEPTVGIDAQSRKYIISAIKQLNAEGSTIIYTSHYIEEVESLCNRISILDGGKVIASGNKEDLKRQAGIKENVTFTIDGDRETFLKFVSEVSNAFSGIEIAQNGNSLIVWSEEINSKINNILSLINIHNINITEVNINKPNLEKIYFKLIEAQKEIDG